MTWEPIFCMLTKFQLSVSPNKFAIYLIEPCYKWTTFSWGPISLRVDRIPAIQSRTCDSAVQLSSHIWERERTKVVFSLFKKCRNLKEYQYILQKLELLYIRLDVMRNKSYYYRENSQMHDINLLCNSLEYKKIS